MSTYSAVAYSFTNENWKKLCELAKTDERALNKHYSFDNLLREADVNRDHPDGRHHVIYWSWITWYEYEHKAGISFFQDVGEKLCNESMYVDDENSYDYSPAEDDEGLLLRDGDGIKIQGITLANFERYNLLTSVVKAFMKAAPEAAREWREENEGEYGCDEFDELFEGA